MNEKYQAADGLDSSMPDKHEVAKELGIPLDQGYNGDLTTKDVGRIGGRMGGKIGGQKVRKMIQAAEAEMAKEDMH
ncbi:alpha/beta-type small acid-soluble spore protein [Anaerosinus massiliensis]|uniref:alpha/beta-type small acid-soluble spore protein n=1 Tax=Massilibacillus massiliensis TaxID=1806837 RepID=UPI000DA611DF|nr:alpha/beta-type small acid-soluble spore protein [Massilibacillus massiliensis]